jgi:hypothetical protein
VLLVAVVPHHPAALLAEAAGDASDESPPSSSARKRWNVGVIACFQKRPPLLLWGILEVQRLQAEEA